MSYVWTDAPRLPGIRYSDDVGPNVAQVTLVIQPPGESEDAALQRLHDAVLAAAAVEQKPFRGTGTKPRRTGTAPGATLAFLYEPKFHFRAAGGKTWICEWGAMRPSAKAR